jgi:lipoate-protein ligase A
VLKEGVARQKVPGGKLLIVKLRYGDRINELQLQGDFFVFPEDALSKIENAFIGMGASEDITAFSSAASDAIRHNNIELIGITPDAIAQTIKMALSRSSERPW